MTVNTFATVSLSASATEMLRTINDLGSVIVTTDALDAGERAASAELHKLALINKAWQKGGRTKFIITEKGLSWLEALDNGEMVNDEGVAIDTTEGDDGAADAEAEELISKGEGDTVLPSVKTVVGMPDRKSLPWKAHPGVVSESEQARRAKTMELKKEMKAKNGKPQITADELKAAEQLKKQLATVADEEKPAVKVTEKAPKISKPKTDKPAKAEGDTVTRIKDHAAILALVAAGDVTETPEKIFVTSTGQRISKNQFGQLVDRNRIGLDEKTNTYFVIPAKEAKTE